MIKKKNIKFILFMMFLFIKSFVFSQNIDSIEQIIKKNKLFENLDIYTKLVEYYLDKNPQKAFSYINQSLNQAKEQKCKECEAKAYFYLAGYFKIKKDYGNVFVYLKKSLTIFEFLKKHKEIALIQSLSGDLNTNFNDFDKALTYYLAALDSYSKNDSIENTKKEIMLLCLKISQTYFNLNDSKKTFEFANKAIQIGTKNKLNDELFLAYFHIGNVYKASKNYLNALEFYNYAINLKIFKTNKTFVSDLYKNIGKVYYEINNTVLSNTYFLKAYEIDSSENNIKGLAFDKLYLGKIKIIEKDYTKSDNLLNNALNLAKTINYKPIIKECYAAFADLYEAQGEFKQALFNQKFVAIYKDSIYNELNYTKNAEILAKYKADSKEIEIENLAKNNEITLKENRNQKFLIHIVFISALFLLLLSFLLYRQYILKKKGYKLLSIQNDEVIKSQNELKRVNSELTKSEERFRLIVETMPVLIVAFNENKQIVFWNNECEIVTGFTSDDIINDRNAIQILFPDEGLQQLLAETFASNSNFKNFETEIHCKDGKKKIISWSNVSNLVKLDDWKLWTIGVEVTERDLFEKSLIQEKAQLNSLINSIPDLIFYKDKNCKYLGVNVALCKFFDKNRNDFIGKTDFDIFDEKLAKQFYENDLKILNGQNKFFASKWKTESKNKKVVLETFKVPFADENNNILGLIGICRDITEKYNYEEALKNQKEKAIEADKQKSAFLANMSHDIRTPMNAIIGFTDLLSRQNLSEEQRQEYISYISNCGKDLLHLIDDIIDIAKIEADQIKIIKTHCPINKILLELLTTFEQEKRRKGKNSLELSLKTAIVDNKLTIYSDPYRFRQIFANLIGNALKFTDKGRIEFGFTLEKNSDNKEFLKFFVKDSGIGMPEDKLKTIFERFGRIDDVIHRNLSGTGLGLAITKSLVELLGGEIWVESEINSGSEFYFTLPFEKIEITKKISEIQKQFIESYNWKNKTILVAEDDKMNFRLLERALQRTEIRIIWVQNGEDAVETCKKNDEILLVLMDIQMPRKNGYIATKEIKTFRPDLPVIAQTAFAMSGEKEKSKSYGCDEYMSKPIIQKDLLEIMSKYIDR